MYSIRADRPLDPTTTAILIAIHDVTEPLGLPIFVVGATARDILLTHVFGIETGRATLDVDFAVALQDWQQFEQVRQRLLNDARFHTSAGAAHRLYYRADDVRASRPVDLIPFGDIENPATVIKWPPDMAVMMNVTGFRDAWQAAIEVEMAPGRAVRVASLAGLTILKLFAWKHRGLENTKDAEDLQFLLQHYASAGNLDRLYDEEYALLEAADHNVDLAGMALLGKDVAALASAVTRTQCIKLLDHPATRNRLAMHMALSRPGVPEAMDAAEAHLTWFRRGLD